MTATVLERATKADEMIERMEPPTKVATMLPKMLKMVPLLMFLGFAVVLAGLALGVVAADAAGTLAALEPGTPQFEDTARDARYFGALVAPVAFTGMALLLFGITITLLAIAGALRTMGNNVVGLILEHESSG